MTLVALGLRNREAARCLGLGESTVKAHVADICTRLGVRTRTEAAVWMWREGGR